MSILGEWAGEGQPVEPSRRRGQLQFAALGESEVTLFELMVEEIIELARKLRKKVELPCLVEEVATMRNYYYNPIGFKL